MPNSTASNSRSKLIFSLATKTARVRRAVRGPCQCLLAARLLERRHHRAGLVRVRVQHHLLAGLPELVEVLVGDAAELRLHHARVRPLAVGTVLDPADAGV